MEERLLCFTLSPPFRGCSSGTALKLSTSNFVSRGFPRALPQKEQRTSVIRASTDKNDEAEQYKEFARFLGDSDATFSRPGGEKAIEREIPIEDESVQQKIERAKEYEEMSQLLGPPQGRFQRKSKRAQSPVKPSIGKALPNNNPEAAKIPELEKEPSSPPVEYFKEALSRKDEYALFEGILRKSGGTGNKPRKGGRRFETFEMRVEGIVPDPWNVDFNLSPKKGAEKKKGSPPPKGTKPLKIPDTVTLTTEQIEQSYWTLEQLLDDEENDWQEEQERKRQETEEKRKAKLMKKPAHPNDPPVEVSVRPTETMVSELEKKPRSVLQSPPKRVSENTSSSPLSEPTEPTQRKKTPVLEKRPQRIVYPVDNETQRKQEALPTLRNHQTQPTEVHESAPTMSSARHPDVAGKRKILPVLANPPNQPVMASQETKKLTADWSKSPGENPQKTEQGILFLKNPKILCRVDDNSGEQ